MKYERYESLLISKDALEFKFVSEGPKGTIQKIVQFVQTGDSDIYNLAFGNLMPDGSVDDHVKNDNKDRDKILATIVAAIYEFTAQNPDKSVLFTGSTPERTRLYRIIISSYLEELEMDFVIIGVNLKLNSYYAELFTRDKEYLAFIIKRKIA